MVSLGRELGIEETGWEEIFLFIYLFIKILTVEIHSILFPTRISELLRPGSSNSFPDSLEVGDQEEGSANCAFMSNRQEDGSGWISSCCSVLWLLTSKAMGVRGNRGVGGAGDTCSCAQSPASWVLP